jgi:hypothetical protein
MTKTEDFEKRTEIVDSFWPRHYYMKVFKHSCPKCQIRYQIDEDAYEGEWILPEKFKPSEKQIKYAESIACYLDKKLNNIITKQQFWSFISNNEEEFKSKKAEEKNTIFTDAYDEIYDIFDPSDFC